MNRRINMDWQERLVIAVAVLAVVAQMIWG